MENFLMLWALVNFVLSLANVVNMIKLRRIEKTLEEEVDAAAR